MRLEKPQSAAVEQVLTDAYDAGRDAVIRAISDYHKMYPRKGIIRFLDWYSENSFNYKMQFKVME